MAPRCYQSLDNGQRCNAPAIMGSKFCRHHDEHAPKQAKPEARESEPLILPSLVDKPSALAALNQVIQALGDGRIKRSVAETLLSAIKFGARLLTEIAEAGLSVLPTPIVRQFQPTGAVALAASNDRPATPPFNPARRYTAPQSNDDSSTARIVRELLAQSHAIAQNQAKS
jgi:hypothetical protein